MGVAAGASESGVVVPGLEPLVVSAPFGNYVRCAGATSTLGTFTLERRRGRVWRVLKTVRYSVTTRAWVNRIGLRNPGIAWLERKVAGGMPVDRSIVSIHGFDADQWHALVDRLAALRPMAMELNLSCPNVGGVSWPEGLFERAVATGVPVIAKVPPIRFAGMVEAAVAGGVRVLHCCNTLPVPQGGLSGKPLMPVSLECVRWVRSWSAEAGIPPLLVIGGGGITSAADVDAYADAGADAFAVGTKAFNPVVLVSDGPLRGLAARAGERASALVGGGRVASGDG